MYGILVDVTKCRGCEKCVTACVLTNGLNPEAAASDRAITKDGLSANRLCTVLPADNGRFVRKSCMHCLEPSCVSACLVGGLRKTEQGAVIYDPDKCIGCRYCMLACPFHIPRYEWGKTAPLVKKCNMCLERVKKEQLPACVEACPYGVMEFGERQGLIEKAHALIDNHPETYLPHVWGEKEWGGTSVLFMSDVDLASVGWPWQPMESIPALTEPLIKKTPVIGLTVGFGLWALSAIINRRNKVMAYERRSSQEQKPAKPGGDQEEECGER
ncbi:4Fe-4S dicluster domain-containing protein [Acidobacteriota bacterium]